MQRYFILCTALALCVGASISPAAADAMLAVGQQAPGFRLPDQSGQWHALTDYRGKWLVLYFYPKDQTPGCTTEACEFRDNVFAFRDVNAVIVGISLDDVESHKEFAEKHGLPFTLLADAEKQTAKSYGVYHRFLGLLPLAKRETFLIDPAGRIAKIYRDVDPQGHSQQVLTDIKALQRQTAASAQSK